jgi:hypothetical protein
MHTWNGKQLFLDYYYGVTLIHHLSFFSKQILCLRKKEKTTFAVSQRQIYCEIRSTNFSIKSIKILFVQLQLGTDKMEEREREREREREKEEKMVSHSG